MQSLDPTAARKFAIHVVQRLRRDDHAALWAGGCVRDQLLGVVPHDYDVATDARPDQIRELFGYRRTLALGAAFGVITVLGRKHEGQIEVATFRSDHGYRDGRRPDHVTFSSPEEDARRRDFTINGMFYDPLADQVIDYVGGQEDLRQRRIRAIGDPAERFAEDRLRLLRAVRFAAVLEAELDPPTSAAMTHWAPRICEVSGERVAAEMRRMLVHRSRARAVALLHRHGLLAAILPETLPGADSPERWRVVLEMLEKLRAPSFSTALALLLRQPKTTSAERSDRVGVVARRWRLANAETSLLEWLLEREELVRRARSAPWPQLQRLLVHPQIEELLVFATAIATVCGDSDESVAYCERMLQQPPHQLNPPPLIGGADLANLGIPPGPIYQELLTAARDAQLEKQVQDKKGALQLVEQTWRARPQSEPTR